MRLIVLAAVLVCAVAPSPSLAEALPVFNPSGPNAEAYGSADGYPAGYPQTQRMLVGNFSHYETVSRTRSVARATTPAMFDRAPAEIDLHYTYRGETHTIGDYLSRHSTTGFLIIKDNTILSEHYQYGRTETDKFMSQSMSKTVASMLVGIAVSEGRIKSLDDAAATYVTGLADSESLTRN